MGYFRYNNFLGLSASTLCLLGTSKCKEILNNINSKYLVDTLTNLKIEVEVLEKVLDNVNYTTKWSNVYTELEPKYNLQVGDMQKKDAIRLYKDLYYALKAYLSDNMEMFRQYPESVQELVKLNEVQEIAQEYIQDVNVISEVSSEQYTLGDHKTVQLSSNAKALLNKLCDSRSNLLNLSKLIDNVIRTKTGVISKDKIFDTPIYSLRKLGNNLVNINNNINNTFKQIVDTKKSTIELKDILTSYETDCKNLKELFEHKDEKEHIGIDVEKGMHKGEYKSYLLKNTIKEHFVKRGMINIVEENSEFFNHTLNRLLEVPNFVKLIEYDAQYVLDIMALTNSLESVNLEFYCNLLHLDLSTMDEEKIESVKSMLIEVFIELAEIGIGGLTFYVFEHFLNTLRLENISDSNDTFHLDKKNYEALLTNSEMMLECIDSMRYFME